MKVKFSNRAEAGDLLADQLLKGTQRDHWLVLGLPRGGLAVAAQVAARLQAPLDLLMVRKLTLPGHRELTMGAIAAGGVRILDDPLIAAHRISQREVDAVCAREERELRRLEVFYRDGRPAPALRGRTVILVDDGVATGATLRAAIASVRRQQPALVIVAVPVIAALAYREMHDEADEIVAVLVPEYFTSIAEWYDDFPVLDDAEARTWLTSAAAPS